MDIERLQKINDLAMELMKQGLVDDREDAVRQAERIMARKDYSSLNDAIHEVKETDKNEEGESKEQPDLGKEKVKEILEKNTAFFVKKIKEFQQDLDIIKEQVTKLKSELNQVKLMGPPRSQQQSPQQQSQQPQQQLPKQETPAEGHPRSGNYNDSEISIEKFFYSGSKR